jgi:hypothetical protein
MNNTNLIKIFFYLKRVPLPFVKEWGWAFLFLFICIFARGQAASFRQSQYERLVQKVAVLQESKVKRQKLLESTRLKVHSISDPEMIKMLLIQSLGLVKEGQIKVIFDESENP